MDIKYLCAILCRLQDMITMAIECTRMNNFPYLNIYIQTKKKLTNGMSTEH